MSAFFAEDFEAVPMLTVGSVVSTLNVVLGPAAVAELPALSEAVPDAMEIPRVPSPEIPVIVTVALLVLPFVTTTLDALAVPVLLSVILPFSKLTVSAPV